MFSFGILINHTYVFYIIECEVCRGKFFSLVCIIFLEGTLSVHRTCKYGAAQVQKRVCTFSIKTRVCNVLILSKKWDQITAVLKDVNISKTIKLVQQHVVLSNRAINTCLCFSSNFPAVSIDFLHFFIDKVTNSKFNAELQEIVVWQGKCTQNVYFRSLCSTSFLFFTRI